MHCKSRVSNILTEELLTSLINQRKKINRARKCVRFIFATVSGGKYGVMILQNEINIFPK